MQTWKMFIRSAGVVTVLTAGAFAAGQAVVPFANASRGVDPAVEEPAPDPVVDPAEDEAPETDDSATTTTEPEAPATDDVPETDDPADDPVGDPAPADVLEESDVTRIDVDAVPSAPVADPAPEAKKAKKVKGDHNCDGHPDNGWHNRKDLYPNYPETNELCSDNASASADSAPADAAASGNNGRSESAKEDGNNGRSESAKQNGNNGRSASAPGRMK